MQYLLKNRLSDWLKILLLRIVLILLIRHMPAEFQMRLKYQLKCFVLHIPSFNDKICPSGAAENCQGQSPRAWLIAVPPQQGSGGGLRCRWHHPACSLPSSPGPVSLHEGIFIRAFNVSFISSSIAIASAFPVCPQLDPLLALSGCFRRTHYQTDCSQCIKARRLTCVKA